MINIPLDGQYKSDSLTVSNQLNVNCYVNIPQTQSFSQANLFGTAGITELSTTGVIRQVNRGSHVIIFRFQLIYLQQNWQVIFFIC